MSETNKGSLLMVLIMLLAVLGFLKFGPKEQAPTRIAAPPASSHTVTVKAVANEKASSVSKKALAEIEKEPRVLSVALSSSGGSLWVGVLDDGSNRDGYAMYVCEVLREHGLSSTVTIHIKDAVEAARGKTPRTLGSTRCK